MRTPIQLTLATALLAMACPTRAGAAMVQYEVDQSQSSLSVVNANVNVNSVPFPITEQGMGGLTASYSGMIAADLTASTFQILSATNLIAGNSGTWDPGNAPANYGLTANVQGVTIDGATRDLALQLSDAAPKPLSSGMFDEADTTTEFTAGTTEYSLALGTTDMTTISSVLTQDATGTGTLMTSGSIETLTIPLDFTITYSGDISGVAANLTVPFSGTIVATRDVPEPASLALLALGGIMLGSRRRRNE